MKRSAIIFLQIVIAFIGITVIAILIRFPLTEGRAAELDLLSIYSDPFILYGYATSIVFFVVLYKAFKLLGYIGQNKAFSPLAIGTLKVIRFCAIALIILIAAAGIFIRIFHDKKDDPAGFLALCLATIFVSIIVAISTVVFEKILQNGIDIKDENEKLKLGRQTT